MAGAILREGENCWKIRRAARAKFLIDGRDYFAALAEALERAEESILIVGWDFDSRIRLRPEDQDAPDLGHFLESLVVRKPKLRINILIWNFAAIYTALQRDAPPEIADGWRAHARIAFHMDASHPLGGIFE